MAEANQQEGAVQQKEVAQDNQQQINHEEVAALKEKANKYDQIQTKYQQDAKFRDVLNKAWSGDYGAEAQREVEKAVKSNAEGDLTAKELNELKTRLADYESKLGVLANNFIGDKVSGERKQINYQYEETFAELAEAEGFKYGSPEYNVLFKNAVAEGNKLAQKYNLVDKNGIADPLLKYNKNLIQEAFKNAIDEFKSMGYDVKERQRQLSEQRRKEQFQRKEDEFKKILDSNKEKLRTTHGRGKFLEDFFRKRLNEEGASLNDLI